MMHSSLSLALLCTLILWEFGLCQDNCKIQDGQPGQMGMKGRDGLPGQKGEKGEPSQYEGTGMTRGQKGDEGSKGEPGDIGMKGYQGDLGPQGPAGAPGPKGISSQSAGVSQSKQSAFSVMRTAGDPPPNQPVTFEKKHVDINDDFDLKTGKFTCKVPGVYYFVFHAMSTLNNCVRLQSDKQLLGEKALSFCDYNSRGSKQVVSGGTVLELSEGEKVWLEVFKGDNDHSNAVKSTERSFLFNGFLISAKA